jgi:demethylmenaquinone methyltransferase / 2-methoxy-6-polyprenyl-1,4-benzoquinol methylase
MEHSKEGNKVKEMFASIAPKYELTNDINSLGVHHLWRLNLSKRLLPGEEILDLATGTGSMIPYIEKKFCKITAADFCPEMLEQARTNAKTTYVLADATCLPFTAERFSAVTVSFGVRNFSDLELGLEEILRVMQKGAQLLILEFGMPHNWLIQHSFKLYSKYVIPNIGWLITGNRYAYEYLPETAAAFPYGDSFCQLLTKKGFTQCTATPLSFGVAYLYEAKK